MSIDTHVLTSAISDKNYSVQFLVTLKYSDGTPVTDISIISYVSVEYIEAISGITLVSSSNCRDLKSIVDGVYTCYTDNNVINFKPKLYIYYGSTLFYEFIHDDTIQYVDVLKTQMSEDARFIVPDIAYEDVPFTVSIVTNYTKNIGISMSFYANVMKIYSTNVVTTSLLYTIEFFILVVPNLIISMFILILKQHQNSY